MCRRIHKDNDAAQSESLSLLREMCDVKCVGKAHLPAQGVGESMSSAGGRNSGNTLGVRQAVGADGPEKICRYSQVLCGLLCLRLYRANGACK